MTMADDENESQDGSNGDGGAGDGGESNETPSAADVEKWKALARKHEAEAKKNSDAAKRLKEIEDAQKSESERSAEQLRLAQEEATAARRDATLARVAHRKGLTEAQAKRLQGTTEEELEADADELLATFKGSADEDADKGDSKRRSPERLRAGAVKDAEPEEKDPRKLAASLGGSRF